MGWQLPARVDNLELELALPVRISYLQEATPRNCVSVREVHGLLVLPIFHHWILIVQSSIIRTSRLIYLEKNSGFSV
jgi:hypothetical protein